MAVSMIGPKLTNKPALSVYGLRCESPDISWLYVSAKKRNLPSKGTTMMTFKTSISAVTVALFLAACGGGSSPSASIITAPPVAVPAPAPAPVVTPAAIQTSVPALTYAAISEEFQFITAWNQFRAQMGLGLLAQSAVLDKASLNHLEYVLKNDVLNGGTVNFRMIDPATNRPMFHIEQGSKPLFTGVQEFDRARSVGFTGSYVGEMLAFPGRSGARVGLESLAATIYHRVGLMNQSTNEVGVAAGQDVSRTLVMEAGTTKAQSQASDYIGVYPSANQTGVGLNAYVETPNPFPDLSTANADFLTKTGYPVSVAVKEGVTLEVVSFTLTEASAAAPLDARILTSVNDPNRYLASNIAFLIAKAPLKASTTYTAKFSGRMNNVLVNKEWQFTTRP